jgi:tight adherence protein B
MLQETSLGVNAEVALRSLGERVSSPDMDMVITAITIQRTVGGNLASLLDGVSYTMRERERIRGDVKTLTSQQRMTGMIIGALPIFLGLLFFAINPDYMAVLFTETVGQVFIVVAVMLEILGIVTIRAILALDV